MSRTQIAPGAGFVRHQAQGANHVAEGVATIQAGFGAGRALDGTARTGLPAGTCATARDDWRRMAC
jgi:hypothetical protein